MIRVVLAVLLAAALLAVSLPAVQSAAEASAADAAARNADDIRETARALVATSDPSAPGVPGARTWVRVSFPDRGFATAGLDYLAVGGHLNRSLERDTAARDVLVYRVPGNDPRVVSLPFDVRAGATDADPLVLRGDARLALGYVETGNGTAITVARAD